MAVERKISGPVIGPVAEQVEVLSVAAIALPVETKNEFEFPEAHLKKLRSVIPEVTRILIIGWRGTEEHFLKLWPESGQPRVNRVTNRNAPSGP